MIEFFYSDRKQINGHLGPESIGGGGQATGEGLEGTLEVKKNILIGLVVTRLHTFIKIH